MEEEQKALATEEASFIDEPVSEAKPEPEPAKKKIPVGPITTFTNHVMIPVLPRESDFRIFDIAHALSQQPRAGGHFKTFFSVAQHSLNCSCEGKARGYSKRIQLALLLHDAAEAYLCDLPRPIKQSFPDFSACEDRINAMIFRCFQIGELVNEEQKIVDEIDTAFMYYEFEKLHAGGGLGVTYYLTHDWPLEMRDMKQVEQEFIDRFRSLVQI